MAKKFFGAAHAELIGRADNSCPNCWPGFGLAAEEPEMRMCQLDIGCMNGVIGFTPRQLS